MQTATQAYARTAQATGSPRELEAQLLLRAAAKLQAIEDGHITGDHEVIAALRYNRRLWLAIAEMVARADNPLPIEIKRNVASLAVFVVKHSMALETSLSPERSRLKVLININRELAAGLRT